MIGGEKFHGVKEDGSKAERLCNAVRRVEVNVCQNVGHRIVDNVTQTREAVH